MALAFSQPLLSPVRAPSALKLSFALMVNPTAVLALLSTTKEVKRILKKSVNFSIPT